MISGKKPPLTGNAALAFTGTTGLVGIASFGISTYLIGTSALATAAVISGAGCGFLACLGFIGCCRSRNYASYNEDKELTNPLLYSQNPSNDNVSNALRGQLKVVERERNLFADMVTKGVKYDVPDQLETSISIMADKDNSSRRKLSNSSS